MKAEWKSFYKYYISSLKQILLHKIMNCRKSKCDENALQDTHVSM